MDHHFCLSLHILDTLVLLLSCCALLQTFYPCLSHASRLSPEGCGASPFKHGFQEAVGGAVALVVDSRGISPEVSNLSPPFQVFGHQQPRQCSFTLL